MVPKETDEGNETEGEKVSEAAAGKNGDHSYDIEEDAKAKVTEKETKIEEGENLIKAGDDNQIGDTSGPFLPKSTPVLQ